MLLVRTLTNKGCKGPQTNYAEEQRRIYDDLISENNKYTSKIPRTEYHSILFAEFYMCTILFIIKTSSSKCQFHAASLLLSIHN